MSQRWYGSLNNRIMEESQPRAVPAVGTPAMRTMWSDRHPVVVTEVLTPNKIKVQEVEVTKWQDNYGVEFGKPIGLPMVATRRKGRGWKLGTNKHGDGLVFGKFGAYRDPSF